MKDATDAGIASVALRLIGGARQLPHLRQQLERELSEWTEYVTHREAQLAAIDYLLRPACAVSVNADVLDWLTTEAPSLTTRRTPSLSYGLGDAADV
jgi:hypothetical protein